MSALENCHRDSPSVYLRVIEGEHTLNDLTWKIATDPLRLLARWGWKYGVQSLIAAHLGVHKSTISRDLTALMPLTKECPRCHQLMLRRWWSNEEA
jgi:hypothetical protein